LADVHRGDHRSKLAIVQWIVPMIKIIWSIQHIVVGRVLEAGNMQRLGQPDLALGACDVDRRAEPLYPIRKLSWVCLPSGHAAQAIRHPASCMRS
jgi:hypothetical protein